MAAKVFLALCASALLVQTISVRCQHASAPCYPAPAPYPQGPVPCHPVCAPAASASGGGFSVTSSSLYAPSGISVVSENDISGILDASGNLPLLAAVAFENTLPTIGEAGTIYSCGNEKVGIASDSLAAAGVDAAGYGPGFSAASAANAVAAAAAAAAAYGPGAYGPPAYALSPYAPGPYAAPCGCY